MDPRTLVHRIKNGQTLVAAGAGLCAGMALAGAFFNLYVIPLAGKLGLLLGFGLPLALAAWAAARAWLWPHTDAWPRKKLAWTAAGSLALSAGLLALGGLPTLPADAAPSVLNATLTVLLGLTRWLGLAALLFTTAARFPILALVFAWPFVVLFPYVFSVAGRFVALGNDFTPFYYVYKVYLLDCLANGRLPLWSPSESAGYPFYSSPLAESFYPLNLPLTWIYKLNGGYTLQDHQIFTVFGIAIFSVGLYLWLTRLGLPRRAVLVGVLALAVSFKVTEIIRFPNAIHTAAWYPWILLALTGVLLAKTGRARLGYAALLAFSGICLATGGYPYFSYYIVFLAGPYFLIFLLPRLRRDLIGADVVRWKEGLIALAGAVLAAAAVCLPWLLAVTRLMAETSKRAGGDLEHALSYGFSWQDTAASIFFPPAAMPEGWFYFGALAGLLVALFLLVQPFRDGPERRLGGVRLFFGLWLAGISLLSYGEQTGLFDLLYKVLPFFNQLRAWSRLNIVLVPIFAWLTALAWREAETWLSGADAASRRRVLIYTGAAAAVTLVIQAVYLLTNTAHLYWNIFFIPRVSYLITTFLAMFGADVVYPDAALSLIFRLAFVAFSLAAACLLAWAVWRARRIERGHFPAYLNCLLAGFVLFSAANLAFAGPWLWTNGVTTVEERKPLDVERQNMMSFANPRKDAYTTLTLSQSFSAGSDLRWHFDRYKDFRATLSGDPESEARLLGIADGKKLYFTSDVNPASARQFLEEADGFEGSLKVVDYTGDWLVAQVETPKAGYLHFIDNWDEGWRARVDGRPVELARLFGVFKSAPVPAGEHTVEMMYCPAVFAVFNPACR